MTKRKITKAIERDIQARKTSANRGHDARNERVIKQLRARFGASEGDKHAKQVLAMASAVIVAFGGD